MDDARRGTSPRRASRPISPEIRPCANGTRPNVHEQVLLRVSSVPSAPPRRGQVELDPLVPVRDVRREAERLDLGLQGDLGVRVAVDEEDPARIARHRPAACPSPNSPSQSSSSRLVGVRREAADRPDLAAHLAGLAVEADLLGPGLQVRAERPLALVADEQDRRRRVVDEVAQVADDAAAGEHPVGGHDQVRPRRALDGLRRLDVVGDDLVRVVERRRARRAAARPVSSS